MRVIRFPSLLMNRILPQTNVNPLCNTIAATLAFHDFCVPIKAGFLRLLFVSTWYPNLFFFLPLPLPSLPPSLPPSWFPCIINNGLLFCFFVAFILASFLFSFLLLFSFLSRSLIPTWLPFLLTFFPVCTISSFIPRFLLWCFLCLRYPSFLLPSDFPSSSGYFFFRKI